MIKIKLLLLTFLFSSFQAISFELVQVTAFLPEELKYIGIDEKARVKDGYQYKAEFKKYDGGKSISIQKFKKNDSIEKLLSSLFESYKKKDFKLMSSYFDKEGQKQLEKLPQSAVEQNFEAVGRISDPKVEYILKYKKGYIVSWFDQSFLGKRKIYLRKVGEVFKVSSMYHDENDHYANNMNVFILKSPFDSYEPQIDKKFDKIKNGQEKTMSFKLKEVGNFIHIFKKDEENIRLTLIDNYKFRDNPFTDKSDKEAYIEVSFKGENFKEKGEQELFFIESTYPMDFIPKRILSKAKALKITKED